MHSQIALLRVNLLVKGTLEEVWKGVETRLAEKLFNMKLRVFPGQDEELNKHFQIHPALLISTKAIVKRLSKIDPLRTGRARENS